MIASPDSSESVEDPLVAFDPASILFHGSGLLVVDKPAGLPVHRGTKHELGLAEIISNWARLNPGLIELRRGRSVHPVHRLDREASGVLIFGTTPAVRRRCQRAFAERLVQKSYLTLVGGPVEARGVLRGRVRSKMRGVYRSMRASLSFRRLAGDDRLSLVRVRPREGYTHQIRALFAQAGRPVAGDLRYGKPKPSRQFLERFGLEHLLLHAASSTLPAEVLGTALEFSAPLPETFLRVAREKGWDLEAILAASSARAGPVRLRGPRGPAGKPRRPGRAGPRRT